MESKDTTVAGVLGGLALLYESVDWAQVAQIAATVQNMDKGQIIAALALAYIGWRQK